MTSAEFWNLVINWGGIVVGGIVIIWLISSIMRFWMNFRRSLELVFLRILIPKKDSKEDKGGGDSEHEQFGSGKEFKKITGIMVHFLENLQIMFSRKIKNRFIGQNFFSLEYAMLQGELNFFMVVPRAYKELVEKQVTGFYKDAVIDQVPDYNIFQKGNRSAGTYLILNKSYAEPLMTFQKLESETINPILNAFSKINLDEGAAVQIMLRPVRPGWRKKCRALADALFTRKSLKWFSHPFSFLASLLGIIIRGPQSEYLSSQGADGSIKAQVTQNIQDMVKLIADKSEHTGFDSIIRIVASAPSQPRVQSILQSIRASFEQFHAPSHNSLYFTEYHSNRKIIESFIFRNFKRGWIAWYKMLRRFEKTMILGAEEIASMYHFPDIRYNPSTIVKWQDFKVEPAPQNIPKEGLLLGHNTYRGSKKEIRIMRDDRRRHFYMIGKSGTGKSTLLENMVRQDLQNGEGLCLIDPHGDLVEAILPYIPRKRADDIVYFNPGDLERPIGLNILEGKTADEREFMAQEALSIFIKMFGEEIMGPRLQHYFRNGCLTLMEDQEEGATLIDLTRLFTDEAWQRYKVSKVKNPVVRSFWTKEMASSGAREKQEIIPYFNSKFGPFVTNGLIRNVIGQTKSAFNLREAMDQGKIILCNLSKGKTGELNSQLIGSILVAKIQQAAMSRVNIPEKDRKDFYLYVDEFQNFVTDSFASILSEARKYRLNLIVAHQYISQITKGQGGGKGKHEDTEIRDAVFGNVGSMLCFKIGAQDAETMEKEFSPVFSQQDLINIANYKACIKLNINNATSRGFTLETIYDQGGRDEEAAEAIRQLSRLKYGRDREFVETEIFKRITT
ncbi:type IV secretion system DNA-binding domain-containing protein [Candidatus Gracilibacteria bacterium]|nr:type IV secretion system DNA-binding domain-containing protein [Candidatus Gracilibacteria bacterium]MCF7856101.1 type IV secretion system DNA-binding domain-containing protein [Candidatus Gracilibacteria bacterium]MCF7896520.1 type IV secretion system DNA-binding domain-containing protein [Candidatus Gracilibacteria bacterium]